MLFIATRLLEHENCKAFPVYAIKAYWGSKVTAPLILNLGTWWTDWLASLPGSFIAGKRNLIHRRLGAPQDRSGHFGKEINLLLLPGFGHRTVQSPAQSVYRLRYSGWIARQHLRNADVHGRTTANWIFETQKPQAGTAWRPARPSALQR